MPADVVLRYQCPKVEEITHLYRESGLNAPLGDPQRMERMFSASSVVISAWHSGTLIGLVRVLTDFSFNAFIADLAVLPAWQGKGIGSRLMRLVTTDYPHVKFIVHPGNGNREFYMKLGFVAAAECVTYPRRSMPN